MLLLLHFVEQPDGLPVVGGRAELPVDDEEQRLLVKRMDVDQPEIAVGPYPHLCGRAAFATTVKLSTSASAFQLRNAEIVWVRMIRS